MLQPTNVFAHSTHARDGGLLDIVRQTDVKTVAINIPLDIENYSVDALLLDDYLLDHYSLEQWLRQGCALLIPRSLADKRLSGEVLPAHAMVIPDDADDVFVHQAVAFASEYTWLHRAGKALNSSLQAKGSDLKKLVELGIALSAETELDELLAKILDEGQKLVGCDAASLFLVDRSDPEQVHLTFKLTQNQSLDPSFKEKRIPLTGESIVGHVAISGDVLNIEDVYKIPADLPYEFNRSFDQFTGYRTLSLVAIPMIDQRQRIVGVLEFINRKKDNAVKLTDPGVTEQQVLPFDEHDVSLLRALSSQAAVAIENRQLLDDVNKLFDSFVKASVFAIEQRDPTTSGHSFRVADLCDALAQSVSQCSMYGLAGVEFSGDQLRELRYAALLHDFGKVGVREHVLVKAKKLSPESVEILHYRVALAKQQLQNQALAEILQLIDTQGSVADDVRRSIENRAHRACLELDEYLQVILKANEPTMLAEGSFEYLQKIREHMVNDHRGNLSGLISDDQFRALSITKGSLTLEERQEIESHVVHTVNFLKLIPWTTELSGIPDIAGAHHEKLHGKGYPNRLHASDICYQSRIMTICDIYDALTASDRPYKPAMPVDMALSILESEANSGAIDGDLVKLFINSQSYRAVENKRYGVDATRPVAQFHHHVCDYDLHTHS